MGESDIEKRLREQIRDLQALFGRETANALIELLGAAKADDNQLLSLLEAIQLLGAAKVDDFTFFVSLVGAAKANDLIQLVGVAKFDVLTQLVSLVGAGKTNDLMRLVGIAIGAAKAEALRQYQNQPQEGIYRLQQENSKLSEEKFSVEDAYEKVLVDLSRMKKERKDIRESRPTWLQKRHQYNASLGFVLMPYSTDWSEAVYDAISHVLMLNGFQCNTARLGTRRSVMDDIWEGISSCRMVIADLTGNNPNVAYEVGIADVLGKDVILLAQNPNDVVFDFRSDRLLVYKLSDLDAFQRDLDKRVKKIPSRREES